MTSLDARLPDSDGVKWFNFLYLEVTKAVAGRSKRIEGLAVPATGR
jgi:hypothetical protein